MTDVLRALFLLALLIASPFAAGDEAGSTDAALAAQRAWWHAYAAGDRAMLEKHTAETASVTFSSGTVLGRAQLLEEAAKHAGTTGFTMEWSDEAASVLRDNVAVATATSTERAGASTQVFRLMTVLERAADGTWRMRLAQSTRVSRFSDRVPVAVSGRLEDVVGRYRTPRGKFLRFELRGTTLWMVEPDGKAIEMAPVGPGIVEAVGRSPLNGVLRFVFSRDASGAVTSLSRLTEGQVDVFPAAREGETQ